MALRIASETPGSNTLIFGLNVFIAARRVDHASNARSANCSAVVCAQYVLCHLETERSSAVARRKLSRS
jgi:hypothetical protein